MSTIATRDALEAARNGLQWYRDTYPEADSGADDEMMAQIDAALADHPAALLEAVEFKTFSVFADTEFRDAEGKLLAVVSSGKHHRRMTTALRTALAGEVKP